MESGADLKTDHGVGVARIARALSVRRDRAGRNGGFADMVWSVHVTLAGDVRCGFTHAGHEPMGARRRGYPAPLTANAEPYDV
jgi:hypothetical protein